MANLLQTCIGTMACSPIVCGASCVKTPMVCANSGSYYLKLDAGTLNIPTIYANCILNSGGTSVMRFASGFAQACTCLSTPIVCATAYVRSPIVCAQTMLRVYNSGASSCISLLTCGGSERGFLQARETAEGDGNAGLNIATSGGEQIYFRDGGLAGTVNMHIDGAGVVGVCNCLISPVICTTSRIVTADNMFMGGGQFYLGAVDGNTDDTYRMYGYAAGKFVLQSRESGTWTTRFDISTAGAAAFCICVQSPIVCGTSCLRGGYVHSSGMVYAGTCICSSIICGISQIKGQDICATNHLLSDGNLTVKGNVIYHCGGSPEFRWGTASTHVNWRMAVQETISNAWEIGSGLVDADVSNDTFTRQLWVGTNYICGSCCFKAPAIYGASWVCSDAKVSGTCTCGRVCLRSPYLRVDGSSLHCGHTVISSITNSCMPLTLQSAETNTSCIGIEFKDNYGGGAYGQTGCLFSCHSDTNLGETVGFHFGFITSEASLGVVVRNTNAASGFYTGSGNSYITNACVKSPVLCATSDICIANAGTGTGNGSVNHLSLGNFQTLPQASWSESGVKTGRVEIELPDNDGATYYGMYHIVVDMYEYCGNCVSSFVVGGHNWSCAWANCGANMIAGCTNKTVRLAYCACGTTNCGGKNYILIGEANSVWSYGHVVVSRITNGGYYNFPKILNGTYNITRVTTSTYDYCTGDLLAGSRFRSAYIKADSHICSGNELCSAGFVKSPIVCATSCVCAPTICAASILCSSGNAFIAGCLVVGAGGNNRRICTRHVDGKCHTSDAVGELYLQYNNGYPVYVGSTGCNACLLTYGKLCSSVCVASPIVCATTCVKAAALNSTGWVYAATYFQGPILYPVGTTSCICVNAGCSGSWAIAMAFKPEGCVHTNTTNAWGGLRSGNLTLGYGASYNTLCNIVSGQQLHLRTTGNSNIQINDSGTGKTYICNCVQSPIVCATTKLGFGACATTHLCNNGNYMRIQTQYGYTDIGPGNTTWSHFYTDRGGWYFDKKICSANSVQAPIVCATNCVHTTNLRGTGVTGNATPVLCIGHGAGSHTGDAIRIQASNSGRTIYTSGTVGSGCFYVTSSYNANPSVYTSGKFCSGNTFMCSNCICVAGTIRSANCVCAAQCLIAQCNVCGVGGVHSPIVCATTWVGVANGGILGIGTTCNNTGKLRFYNNNATNYYMDWVSNAARSYQFCGSGSSAAFKTCFVQGSTGGHDVYASGCLQSPIVCATAGANIGSAASQGTTLCVVAQNTAGAPATTTAIWLKGYEGRGIGTFFGDVTYAGKEWFTGMNYSGGFGSWNVGYDASGGQAEYGANTKFKVESSGTVVSYAVHTVCTCLQSPIVCATNFVKGNILCATATAGIGTAAHSTYPLMLGGNTRYQFAICNSGASNAYYPWLVHDTDNLIVHFNGIGDVLHLHRSGYLCTTGCIKSPVGYFSNYATIKGTGNNSGKSDFTVHTGGDATLALSGGEVRAGDNDVNWSMAMRRSGCLEAYGQELKLGVVEGNRNICLCPSGTGCVHMKGVLMLGSTAIAGEGSSDVIRTRNVASVHNYITTCSTGWGAWNQWIRYVAGVNTWRIGTFDAACASGLSLWRLAGRARTGNAEINYIVAGPRLTGGTDRVALYCPYTFTGGGYDGAGTHYPIGAGGIVCGATCVKSPIICSTGYICGNTICSIAEWFRNGASGTGLYNSATQQHWYSDHNDWWNIAGGGACNGIKFRDTHNGTTRGCILSNNSNQIGFVDSGGAWRILVNTSTDIRLCNNTCVYGNLYVSGLVCTEGVEGDAFSSVSCKLNSVSCFNTTCSTGHDAIYDIYVSANPNSGGSGVYRDVVHMTTYVTTGYDGMAVTKYINTVEHFSRGNAHSSGGGPVCASVHLLVGLVGCECYVQGCNTCLQVRICGGNTGTNAQYRTSECVLIKRVL